MNPAGEIHGEPMRESRREHLTLLILAAGIGSRFGGSKQLEPIGPSGELALDYSVYDALRAGFHRVVLVIRPEMEPEVRRLLQGRYGGRVEAELALQRLDALTRDAAPPPRKKPWGTAHAVLSAEGAVSGPFACVNADDFYGANSFVLAARFLRASAAFDARTFALVSFPLRETLSPVGGVSRALCEVSPDHWLLRITELHGVQRSDGDGIVPAESGGRVVPGDAPVSMNLWCFTPEIFPLFRAQFREFLRNSAAPESDEFSLPDAVQQMIAAGRARVRVLSGGGPWCGMTYREDLPAVRQKIREWIAAGHYPERLFP